MLVPQHRNRVYIVAVRSDVAAAPGFSFSWPSFPPGAGPSLASVLDPDVPERYRLSSKQWAEVTRSAFYHKHPELRVPPTSGAANTLRASYRSGYKLYSQFVAVGSTDHAGKGAAADGASSSSPVRFFTPRECARLMGFPDTFRVEADGIEEVSVYHALGNAVTPPMVRAIAEQILRAVAI